VCTCNIYKYTGTTGTRTVSPPIRVVNHIHCATALATLGWGWAVLSLLGGNFLGNFLGNCAKKGPAAESPKSNARKGRSQSWHGVSQMPPLRMPGLATSVAFVLASSLRLGRSRFGGCGGRRMSCGGDVLLQVCGETNCNTRHGLRGSGNLRSRWLRDLFLPLPWSLGAEIGVGSRSPHSAYPSFGRRQQLVASDGKYHCSWIPGRFWSPADRGPRINSGISLRRSWFRALAAPAVGTVHEFIKRDHI